MALGGGIVAAVGELGRSRGAPAAAPTIDPRSADLEFIAAIVSDQPDDASFAVGDDGGEPACRGPSSCWPLANQQSLGPG
jgi:hypothetical protein